MQTKLAIQEIMVRVAGRSEDRDDTLRLESIMRDSGCKRLCKRTPVATAIRRLAGWTDSVAWQ